MDMDLDDKKKQLEIEKLEHEVKLQKRPLLFISTYAKIITISFQLFTGVIAFLFAYKNNWFNLQHEKLEVQKMLLEYDIKEFTIKKQNLLDSIVIFKHINDSIFNLIKQEQIYNTKLKYENAGQKQNVNEYIDFKDSLNNIAYDNHFNSASLHGSPYHKADFVSWYILGRIRDQNHNKIVNADVLFVYFLPDSDKINIIAKAKSDSNGYFLMEFKRPIICNTCSWKIKIIKNGYKDFLEKTSVSTGGNSVQYYYIHKL